MNSPTIKRLSLYVCTFSLLLLSATAQTTSEVLELVRVAIRPYGNGPETTLADYQYRVRNTTITYNKKGNVEETETELTEITPVNGEPRERVIERNGRPPSEKEAREAEKRDRKDQKRRQKRAHDEFRFGRDFLLGNDFELVRTEKLDGREVRVVAYAPKKHMPKGIDADDFKNIAGTLWIAVAPNFTQLIRHEAHLTGTRRFAVLLASASEAQFEVSYAEPPDKAAKGQQPISWLPKKLELDIKLRVLGMRVHPKITREYSDFVRVVALKERGRLLTVPK